MTRPLLLSIVVATSALCQSVPSTDQQARAILDKSLKDGNPDTRKQAVIALSLAGTREPFLSQVESMLDDKDVQVRVAAVASLVDLPSERTTAMLHKALNDDVPEVSFAAARALWSLNDPDGKAALFAILSGESKATSGFLTKQKREAMRMMHTPRTMFMFALVTGAAFAPVPGVGAGISSMQGLLSDAGVSGRAAVALLFAAEKNAATLQALRDALSDKDWSVRAAAVHSLAVWNDPSLEQDIVPLLDDKKEAVRLRAAAGYLRLELIKGGLEKPVIAAGN
jgi:HEAT repeat protein